MGRAARRRERGGEYHRSAVVLTGRPLHGPLLRSGHDAEEPEGHDRGTPDFRVIIDDAR